MRRFLLLVLMLSLVMTGGCWEKTEVEQNAVVVALGLDSASDNLIKITAQIIFPVGVKGASTGVEKGKQPVFITLTSTGKTFTHALGNLQLLVPRKLIMSHARVFVFGEEFAHNWKRATDGIIRGIWFRKSGSIVIARGTTAEAVLKINMPLENVPAFGLWTILKTQLTVRAA